MSEEQRFESGWRPKGHVEVECQSPGCRAGGRRVLFWLKCDDPLLPEGPFLCGGCLSGFNDPGEELSSQMGTPEELKAVGGVIWDFDNPMLRDPNTVYRIRVDKMNLTPAQVEYRREMKIARERDAVRHAEWSKANPNASDAPTVFLFAKEKKS